jgi:hypothetical protein
MKITLSKSQWEFIGKKAKWIQSSNNKIYILENGILYDEDGEEVFNMKLLIKLFSIFKDMGINDIPKFKNYEEANNFLANIEKESKIKFGRVLPPSLDPASKIRYKDTYKEKEMETKKYLDQRNQKLQKGEW